MRRTLRAARRTAAFTLIEILVVVIILGILASIVVVGLRSLSVQSREAVLREELHFMRTQIALYRAAHAAPPGISPSSGMPDATIFEAQLTRFTDYAGNTSQSMDATFSFAPYLSQMPTNPFTAQNATVVTFVPPGGDVASSVNEQTGWLYQPDTLEFWANSQEYGPRGKKW